MELDEDDGMTGDELFQKYFAAGKRKKPAAGTKTGTRQRNAITDEEISIYRKAVEKCGNDWKKILGFVVKHKDLLSKHVAEKYEIAFKNMDDKERTKSIRNRLGNIGRKAKNSREVTTREERHVLEGGARTAEEVMKAVRGVKEAEKRDPLNQSDDSDYEHIEPAALSDNDEPTDDENEVVQAPPPAPGSPPGKKARKLKKGKDPLKNLHTRAESLLSVGMTTAKMHMKFLKKSAQTQGFSLSESDSD